jgi:hypothetical protein
MRAPESKVFSHRIISYNYVNQRIFYHDDDTKIGILELFSKNRLIYLAVSPENALWIVPHPARFQPVAKASKKPWLN